MAASSRPHYRNQWYWGGEAALRANGDKLELTLDAADAEWAEVEDAAQEFWEEIAQKAKTRRRSSTSSRSTTPTSTRLAVLTTSSKSH